MLRLGVRLGNMFIMVVFLAGCTGTRPATLGLKEGRFSPCPSSPNCVSTLAIDDQHKIDVIHYSSDKEQAKKLLIKIIASMPRSKVIIDDNDYIYAEFRSLIFKFVDDVEFYFDSANKLIHLRSAARLGYFDFGVNRRRMEEIRKRFEAVSKG